ncbi:DUF3857 domain-containing protein [Bdellovibrio sp. HCB2-146]|uniref:DUF3857 domain-containing protein n=1 Tax=Bdellovibrio sp. HCB2-146 TaxID=3394362 RepID=UPI0039BD2D9C
MKTSLYTLLIFGLVLSSHFAFAEWGEADKADVVINHANAVVTVKADGTAVMEEQRMFTSKNEAGRNKLALETIPFVPEIMSVQVLKASSITEGEEIPVDIKTIQVRAASDPVSKQGISGLKELVIPFTNLQMGSTISYKLLTKYKKATFPGSFSMSFVYGLKEPELSGEVLIRSVKKLNFVLSDPQKYLSVEEGQDDKGQYTLKIKMLRAFTKNIKDENIPILTHSSFPSVHVTTLENWNQFVNIFADKYEKILSDELPPSFQAIVTKASTKNDIYEKIDTVTSELASVMTYSGNWTSLDKMFFPRGHKEIAKSKIGDCKDFATSTTAMLRKIGIKANVALVVRRSPHDPMNRIQAIPSQPQFAFPGFNHLIVRVEMPDKSILWVDPTNTTSNSKAPGIDIAESQALNVSKDTKDLEFVPATKIDDHVVTVEKSLKVTPDDKVESTGKITTTGLYASEILNTAFMKNEKAANEIVLALYGSVAKDSVKANYKTRIASQFQADINTHSEEILKREDDKAFLMVPFPRVLTLYGVAYAPKRVTDFYGTPKGKFVSKVFVEGYDFNENEEYGCWAASPWYEIERKIFKVEKGVEIRDQVLLKKDFITAAEINDKDYAYSLGDFESCVNSQAVRLFELDPTKTLADRLKDYTVDNLNKLANSGSGPEIYRISRTMKTIADQLLEKDPTNAEVIVLKTRAARWVAMRMSKVYGPTYLEYAHKWIDEILARDSNNESALIQKSYNYSFGNLPTQATQFFTRAFYASKEKGYELYRLGGYLSEEKKDYKLASQSYLKALSMAKNDYQRGLIWRSLANISSTQDDHKTAEDYYNRALTYLKDDPYIMNDLIILANHRKDYDKAIEIGEKLLKTSDFGAARTNLGNAYAAKAELVAKGGKEADYEKAKEIAMKGLKWDSKNFECHGVLAQAFESIALMKKEIALADRAVEIRTKMVNIADHPLEVQMAKVWLQGAKSIQLIVQKMNRSPASNAAESTSLTGVTIPSLAPPPPGPANKK